MITTQIRASYGAHSRVFEKVWPHLGLEQLYLNVVSEIEKQKNFTMGGMLPQLELQAQ